MGGRATRVGPSGRLVETTRDVLAQTAGATRPAMGPVVTHWRQRGYVRAERWPSIIMDPEAQRSLIQACRAAGQPRR